uniref:RING-type domain-containing protein n=1 Tax=Chrysotila carterae TaxID=13221 RepID=A0A7S4B3C2_CHRCT
MWPAQSTAKRDTCSPNIPCQHDSVPQQSSNGYTGTSSPDDEQQDALREKGSTLSSLPPVDLLTQAAAGMLRVCSMGCARELEHQDIKDRDSPGQFNDSNPVDQCDNHTAGSSDTSSTVATDWNSGHHAKGSLNNVPECAICVSWLCEPISLRCGHLFCRLCLLQLVQFGPGHSSCALCRTPVNLTHDSVRSHAINAKAEAAVCKGVSSSVYRVRLLASREQGKKLIADAERILPVLYIPSGLGPTRNISLDINESSSKVLVRRAFEGNHLCLFADAEPAADGKASLVRIDMAATCSDGKVRVTGSILSRTVMQEVWREEGVDGLKFAKVETIPSEITARARALLRASTENTLDSVSLFDHQTLQEKRIFRGDSLREKSAAASNTSGCPIM